MNILLVQVAGRLIATRLTALQSDEPAVLLECLQPARRAEGERAASIFVLLRWDAGGRRSWRAL